MPSRPDAAVPPTPTPTRLIITLGPPFVLWLVGASSVASDSAYGDLLSGPFSVGLTPVVAAFLVVELVAAIVPRWRPLRVAGPGPRAQLTRAAQLLAVAFMAWELMRLTLELSGRLLPVTAPLLAMVAMNVGWTLALVFLARMVGRAGIVNGYALLLALEWLPRRALAASPRGVLFGLMALGGLAVVAAVLLEDRRALQQHGDLRLRAPLSGLTPMLVASSLLMLPFTPGVLTSYLPLDGLRELYPGSAGAIVASLLLVAVFTLGFTHLFCRPTLVANMLPEVDAVLLRERFHAALSHSMLFTLSLTLGTELLEVTAFLPLVVATPTAVCLAALVLDARDEYRAREKLGHLVTVWSEQRVYALGPLSAALSRADIPHHVRSARLRTLLPFVPLVPAELLVAPGHAVAALAALSARNAESVAHAQGHAPITF